MLKSLNEIWNELNEQGYGSDKGSVHSYLPLYEQILEPYRETAMKVLEIGIFKGASLLMWEQYFTQAKVHGIDCSETPINGMADLRPLIEEGTHNIHIMDGTSEEQIDKEFGNTKFNIVIDDSSHDLTAQLQTINIFKNRLAENGMIILEDLQDIDKDRWIFDAMSSEFLVDIIDLRKEKFRYDDVLIIIKNK